MTYERQMLMDCMKSIGGIDPNTRQNIAVDPLVKNTAIKRAVEDFVQSECFLDQAQETDYRKINF